MGMHALKKKAAKSSLLFLNIFFYLTDMETMIVETS